MGARKPDGSSAKTERVTFTRPAAERIAKVVRQIEQGDRGADGLRFLPRGGGGSAPKTFRICTFTSAWDKNTDKTLTFKYQTTTPNTVAAKNLLFDIPGPATSGASTTKVCIIGKEGTAWYFVNTEKESCDGGYKARELDDSASDSSSAAEISAGQGAQVLVNDNGCVRWIELKKLTVVMNQAPSAPLTLTGDGLQYLYKEVYVIDDVSSSQMHTIAVTACSTTTGP